MNNLLEMLLDVAMKYLLWNVFSIYSRHKQPWLWANRLGPMREGSGGHDSGCRAYVLGCFPRALALLGDVRDGNHQLGSSTPGVRKKSPRLSHIQSIEVWAFL